MIALTMALIELGALAGEVFLARMSNNVTGDDTSQHHTDIPKLSLNMQSVRVRWAVLVSRQSGAKGGIGEMRASGDEAAGVAFEAAGCRPLEDRLAASSADTLKDIAQRRPTTARNMRRPSAIDKVASAVRRARGWAEPVVEADSLRFSRL